MLLGHHVARKQRRSRAINFDGDVHPAFLDVAEQLRRLFRKPGSGGGALAVRLHGEPVLDIWAGTRDRAEEQPWERDTLSLSFSTTKGVTATVIHRLIEQGLLELGAPVASYWEDFGANGKAGITVGELLSHRAGLYDVRHLVRTSEEVLDHERMEKLLAAAATVAKPGARSGYHGFTFGWLASGLARAVTGEDMRTLFQREIAQPLGTDGIHLGVEEGSHEEQRLARLHDDGLSLASLLDSRLTLVPFVSRVADALHVDRFDELLVEPPYPAYHAQMPAVNGCFTARGLATMYAALGGGGTVDGVRLLEPETIERATRPAARGRDVVLGIKMGWRYGYHQAFTAGRVQRTAFGHYGYGGSGAWCDPSTGLAVAFVTNHLGAGTTPIADSRMLRLNAKIIAAAARIR